jgi:hypothetical protein
MNDNIDNEELESEVVDYRTLELTDEHGTEWVEVNYTYDCPISNYLDGEETETIDMVYKGPRYLYMYVNKDDEELDRNGEFETVLREFEVRLETSDFTNLPGEVEIIKLDATKDPLGAEVLSDYHNNYMDMEEWEETPSEKTIPETPIDGYGYFSYEYPIHPDELYDDKKTRWNFETGELDLYKNTNSDVLGETRTWKSIKVERNERLAEADVPAMTFAVVDPDRAAGIETYKQLLRDFPQKMAEAGIDMIFVDSCWPECAELDDDYGLDD